MPKHSVHLRPMEPRVRRLYLVCISTSIALVLVGWVVSIHSAISGDVTQIRADLDASFQKAGEGLNDIHVGTQGYTQDFSESFEAAKNAYEENKAQQ